MSRLIEILKKETESLRTQYIEKTEGWAASYYTICEERKNWNEVKWCEFYGVTPEVKNPNTNMQFLGFPKGFYNKEGSKRHHRNKAEIRSVLSLSIQDYIKKESKYAEIHYEQSILKLASRIEAKGLKIENLKVLTSHIGVNITTTLSDGEKTVRAFTIIAEGEIQRPHYRYLIK